MRRLEYRREWIAEGTRFEDNRERQLLRWLIACWAQFAMPRTNDYETAIPDMEGYTNYNDWQDEWIRRENSIAMVSEHYAELGARIMLWPMIVNGPDRFPDEVEPEVPALTNHS